MARNTIRNILREIEEKQARAGASELKSKTPRPSKLDPFRQDILQLVKDYPDITGRRLYEELLKMGFEGGYTIVKEHLRKVRPKPKRTPVKSYETPPAFQAQMDWSTYRVDFTSSGPARVQCFSYILSYSRRQFIYFTKNQNFYSLIRHHVLAFEYYGGVPESCLYDNMKTVVLRWEGGQPIYNPRFLAFATHYSFRPVAVKPGSPHLKGKIEKPFQYVEGNFLCARKFRDWPDLNRQARWWLKNVNDPHPHKTTREKPGDRFIKEERFLKPLPLKPYDTAHVVYRVCTIDGFVAWDANYYSVPVEYVTDVLPVRVLEHELMVYSPEVKPIAQHELVDGKGIKVEKPEHRAGRKQDKRYDLDMLKGHFIQLGEVAEAYLEGLIRKYDKRAGYHAGRILNLRRDYSTPDLVNALQRALRYHAYDQAAIARILQVNAPRRSLEEYLNAEAKTRIQKMLSAYSVTAPTLSEYQKFLETQNEEEQEDE